MHTFHVRKTGDVILLHLGKGDDMLQCLNQAITEHKIKNGAVVSMIGTLDKGAISHDPDHRGGSDQRFLYRGRTD